MNDTISKVVLKLDNDWLNLLFKLFTEIVLSSGFGELRIVIANGKVQSIKKTESYQK